MNAPSLTAVPVIRLWNCLLVPIQGELTDAAAEAMQDQVLGVIHAHGARGLILDLSGVWVLDSHLCSVLAKLAAAAQLMGSPTAVCGMRPEMALTLQAMGIGMEGIQCTLTLEEALAHFGITTQDQGTTSGRDKVLAMLMGEPA